MNDHEANLPELPVGWTWVTLDEIRANEPNSITDGPFGSNLKTSHYTDSGPRVIRLQNISADGFVDERAHIDRSHFEKLKKHQVLPGDVVIASLGSPLPRACVVPDGIGEAIVKADCIRFKPLGELAEARYVNYALNSAGTQKRAESVVHGLGRPRLNLGDIRRLFIPLAPKREQSRIVTKLEELFSDLDSTVASLNRVQVQLKRYRQSVLKHAVEGKLTAEWRQKHKGKIEPAQELLKRIVAERRAKWEEQELTKMRANGKVPKDHSWKKNYKEPEQPNTDVLPELPEGWVWVSLGQVCQVVSGKTPKDLNTLASVGDVPFYKVSDMNRLGNEVFMSAAEVSATHREAEDLDLRVQPPGTVIFPKRGGAIATNKKRMLSKPSAYDLNLMGLSSDILKHKFIYYWICSFDLMSIADGSNVPQINHKDVEPLPLMLPPLEEQEEIVRRVEGIFSVIEGVVNTIEVNLLKCKRLRGSLLKQAFSGLLVPQDPNDEPARILLERIRAEREKEVTASKKVRSSPKAFRTRGTRRKHEQHEE